MPETTLSHTALNHTALNRTATGPWAVLQHVPFEGPGLITEVAAAHGLDLVVHRLDRGEPLPVAGEVAGLVVMGGPMGARVVPGPAAEIGLGTVTPTDDGLADPVLGPAGADLPVAGVGEVGTAGRAVLHRLLTRLTDPAA
jgi:hypothetical protein